MNFIIVASSKNSLLNFRGPLLSILKNFGRIVCFCPKDGAIDCSLNNRLRSEKISVNDIPLQRQFCSPISDLKCVLNILSCLPNYDRVTLIPYTLKPIFITFIALRLYALYGSRISTVKFIPFITGLGAIFTDQQFSTSNFLAKTLSSFLLSEVLKYSNACIVQNSDDKKDLSSFCNSKHLDKIYVVDGSGVDLHFFQPTAAPNHHTFLMLSRLIPNKGIFHYLEAAFILKTHYSHVKFVLAGPIESKYRDSIESILENCVNDNIVEYLGEVENVNSVLEKCRYFVNPSYYREGVPRSSLEALAHGRPIITTSTPGNKEVVIEGLNGYIIPPRSTPHLVSAMVKLINLSNSSYIKFANQSLDLAAKRFNSHRVSSQTASIILNS